MKNVLVIGSTGQIGSELTMVLRKNYRHGRIVAGYIPGSEPTGDLLESGPAERANVCDAKQIADIVDKYDIDTIYNLAALLSATAERLPLKAWDIQMNGLLNVLEVARHNGIDIPSLCYCENLSIYGGCRLCLVENEKGVLDAACSMQPRNGLVVKTHTEKVLKSRHTTLQLLMNSHRAECLTCEQSGHCKLQEYAHRYNVVEPRFSENTYSHERLDVSSPCITREPSKCILCGLCVRMCSEVQNIGAIDFTKRGKKAIVAPGFGKMLIETGCVGCGQCAAVCPTGALTINRQIPEMWRMLNDPNKRVVVQFAPSVRVGLAEEFGMPANEPVTGKLVTALKRLGVDVVYDTNLSADLTIMEESAEFLEKVKSGAKLPMFTSCCPGSDAPGVYLRQPHGDAGRAHPPAVQ